MSAPTLVASSEFYTTRKWSVMTFSRKVAFRLDIALPFCIWLWAFMSPAANTRLTLAMASQLSRGARRPSMARSYTLTIMIELPLEGDLQRLCIVPPRGIGMPPSTSPQGLPGLLSIRSSDAILCYLSLFYPVIPESGRDPRPRHGRFQHRFHNLSPLAELC